ncbi:hypothetical protein [Bacillus pseudomycoides]|nr:hypothetical protein [Bacillus pseudomycoides]
MDRDRNYVCKSICDTLEVIIEDSNIVKIDNNQLSVGEIGDIKDVIREK